MLFRYFLLSASRLVVVPTGGHIKVSWLTWIDCIQDIHCPKNVCFDKALTNGEEEGRFQDGLRSKDLAAV